MPISGYILYTFVNIKLITFGKGNLEIMDQAKATFESESTRRQNNYIGCEFRASDWSKGISGVYEIVVQDNKLDGSFYSSQIMDKRARFTIHENPVRVEPIPERNLPNKK